jgi:hypothetical protein
MVFNLSFNFFHDKDYTKNKKPCGYRLTNNKILRGKKQFQWEVTALFSYIDSDLRNISFYKKNGFNIVSTVGEYLRIYPELENNFENIKDIIISKSLI